MTATRRPTLAISLLSDPKLIDLMHGGFKGFHTPVPKVGAG